MAAPAEICPLTPEGYLAYEAASDVKHEYVCGETFAMAGTTDAHHDVAANLFTLVRSHLKGSPCRAYFAELKLRVEAAEAFFYPDLFVTCDEADRTDPLVKRHARLVVEVLSEGTAAYDRGEKFDDYRRLESLEEYLLIDSRTQQVIINRKRDAGVWEFEVLDASGTLRLESLKLTLPVAALYVDTDVPTTRPKRVGPSTG